MAELSTAKLCQQVVDLYRAVLDHNLTNGTSGNISLYDRTIQRIALTPTGANPLTLQSQDVSVVDINGHQYSGLLPTSEIEMHLAIYRARPDVNAIIHGHTIYATAVACLREDLPPINYMVASSGLSKIPCTPFALYGTKELAEHAVNCLGSVGKAVLLANHGILTAAADSKTALAVAVQVEYVAHLYLLAKAAGQPAVLSEVMMEQVLQKFTNYGQQPSKLKSN